MSFKIELEFRGVLKVWRTASDNKIGWTVAVGLAVSFALSGLEVDAFWLSVLSDIFRDAAAGWTILSSAGALSVAGRGCDSFSKNLTNASTKLSLL